MFSFFLYIFDPNQLKPISHVLLSGDQVEIITSKGQKPNIGWLDFVVTARARARIKNVLKAGGPN